jgi:MtaA/CmuA family methyltransferase
MSAKGKNVMNSTERIQRRLSGQPVDRPPNFNLFMTFAAHYCKMPLRRYYLDYHALAEANQAMVENFGMDLYQAISDPFREAYDLGAGVEFPEEGLPISRKALIQSAQDFSKLRVIAPEDGRRMSDRLEAIRRMKTMGGEDVPVMGWVEGALAEAGDLCGAGNLMLLLVENPSWLADLLELCCQVEIQFARAQIQAGARMIGLGDALASQISPKMYERSALPYEKRIFDEIHQAGGICRLHICGNTTHILSSMLKSGADIIDLDWMVDFGAACSRFGEQVSFCGNSNPVTDLLQGTPDKVYEVTNNCMTIGGARSFSAAGCEIPDGTPHENLRAQLRALEEISESKVEVTVQAHRTPD